MTQATATTSSATLVIETPGGAIEPRPLMRAELTIGRDTRCDLSIDHPTISRLHARLWRDARGWNFQDLGSQNGSRVNNVFTTTPMPLADGAELHIGRVRAWFFGSGGVPELWRPSADDAEHAGRLKRCRCGYIGWVPDHAAGMTLACAKCGRDLIIRDRPAVAPASTAPVATIECAACHTSIAAADAMTTCSDCGAQMHADCWRENRGCATYGCSQVNILDAETASAVTDESKASPLAEMVKPDARAGELAASSTARSTIPLHAAQTILLALVGLPMFGAPAIAYGTYRAIAGEEGEPIGKRFGYVAANFLAGAAGFIASAYWWLGGIR